MAIGPKILEQTSESLRKIRNSARFILGNIGDPATRAKSSLVPKDELGLVSPWHLVMLDENVEMRYRLIDTSCINCSSSNKLR
jgi:isoleucyl-tRNA synthetase